MVRFSEKIHREAWSRTAPELKHRLVEDSMSNTVSFRTDEKRAQVAAMHLEDILRSIDVFAELDIPENKPNKE